MADLVFGQRFRESLDQRSKVRIVGERQHGTLERSDERREREVGPLLVALSHAEVVLEECIHDAADTERRLDHVRDDFLKRSKFDH